MNWARSVPATSAIMLLNIAPVHAEPLAEAEPSDDIVVTADRLNTFGADFVQAGTFRDARVLDTPSTVTIVRRELLDAQQARSLFDAARNTAGVTQAQISSAVYSNLAIRGITADNLANYRLNGILPIINFIDAPMEDKDRVEVLKGAAGLYYGFATPSGIVNLVTKRPLDKPHYAVEVFGDAHGSAGTAVDLSTPIGDRAGLRINAGAALLETGIDRSAGDRHFISGAFDWRPIDNLKIELDASYVYRTLTEATEYYLTPGADGVITLPPLQPASHNVGAKWMQAKGWQRNLLGRVQYNLTADWSIAVSAGESYLDRDRSYSSFSGYDLATGDGILGIAMTHGNPYRSRIYRADLAGVVTTGPVEHNLLLGVSQNDRSIRVPNAVRYRFAQNLYDPVNIPRQPTPPSIVPNPQTVKDFGAFIFDRATLGDWLQVTVGYRKTDYRERSNTASYTDKSGLWSYGAMVKPFEWLSIYGNHIEGLEPGGTAQQITVNAGETLPAALSKQREFGVKLEPLDGLLLTAAYFHIDRASSYINSENRFVQDGRALYKGVEFSAAGEITPNLSVALSGVVLDARQATGAAAIVGNRIENTAKFSGSLFLSYRVPAVPGLAVSGGAFRVGRRAVNAANQGYAPGYTTFDLGGSYSFDLGGNAVTMRLYGENITGKRYWAATGSALLAQGSPGTVRFAIGTAF